MDLKSELFAHQVDEQSLVLARTRDGKLLLITGHFNQDEWHWTYNQEVFLTPDLNQHAYRCFWFDLDSSTSAGCE